MHTPTNTVLELRHWTTLRRPTNAQCEEELALRTPELEQRRKRYRESEAMATRRFAPGAEHVGELTVKVVRVSNATSMAWVHGVAAGLGRCLTFDAETKVEDTKKVEPELARRVAVLLDEIAASIRMRQVEDVVEPQRGEAIRSGQPDISPPRPAEVP
jgi:hypothetical protein